MFNNLALTVYVRCVVFFVPTEEAVVYPLDMRSFSFFPPFPRLSVNATQDLCGLDGIVPN